MTAGRSWPCPAAGSEMPADDEGGAAARIRNWPSRRQGTAIPACEEGAAPESGYHGQELARWAGGKRDAGLRCGNSPSKCASMDRNWPSQGRGTTMLAGEELAAQAGGDSGQEWPSLGGGRAMPASEEGGAPARARAWTGIGDLRVREHGCRLAMRERAEPGIGIGHLRFREQRCWLAKS